MIKLKIIPALEFKKLSDLEKINKLTEYIYRLQRLRWKIRKRSGILPPLKAKKNKLVYHLS